MAKDDEDAGSEQRERARGWSRRGFLSAAPLAGLAGACGSTARGPGAGAAGAGAGAPAAPAFDLTRASAALEPDTVVASACQFCNSLCGIRVEKKSGRVIEIRGEPADPVQAGGLCAKGPMMRELLYSRHRVTRPLKRAGGKKGDPRSKFEPVSWDEALSGIARELLRLRDAGAPESVANKTSGRMARGAGSIIGRFFELYGSPNATDVGPVCNDAGGNALAATFGLGNFTNGYGVDGATGREDLGASRYLLLFGTNQAETHPVTFEYLLRSRAKTGAKLVVIDPRRTPTGAQADRHVAIRPHTDMALAYGMIATILEEQLYDAAFVERWVVGFAELRAHVKAQGFSAAWAARATDVPEAVIRELARDYARARPAAIFCNAGISHQLNAFHTYRALAFLAAITGNVGVPGGGCNFMHNTWPGGLELPPIEGGPVPPRRQPALPVGPDAFAGAVLDGKPYPLRAVFAAGNPLVDSANTARVRAAYERLELFVYPTLFLEEPAAYADYILPVTSVLEMDCVYMRRDDRAIRWCNQAVPPVGEARPDIEIWLGLAAKMAELDRAHPPAYWTANLRPEWRDYRLLWDEVFLKRTAGMGGMSSARLKARTEPLRWPCPSADHPGVSTLYLDHPSWYAAAAALGHAGKRFLTPSGKIEISTPALDAKLAAAGHAALPPFYAHPETTGGLPTVSHGELVENPINPGTLTPKATLGVPSQRPAGFPLVGMIGRPSVAHFATMTHWLPTAELLNGIRLIQIHPKTAGAAGIANGGPVRVESPRGAITGTALLDGGIREDTIFVPNTFGPAQQVAEEHGLPLYEPANLLLDDRYFDSLSGQQAYKCFACRISKA